MDAKPRGDLQIFRIQKHLIATIARQASIIALLSVWSQLWLPPSL